ncbi:hypothetical protein P886_3181 [Alteromonadaceae bacterium 2753L.S.0a.02]|nr:hypothetical protein P886_3181 [Alteromonadaceae bacterium 2753L.S.0a.02]
MNRQDRLLNGVWWLCAVMALTLVLLVPEAMAQRYVVVNGQLMAPEQIAFLEQMACGRVPNGRYWLNLNTGVWGYEGDPTPRGQLTGNCYGNTQRKPSLSERGLLYSPGEILRD